MREKEEYGQQKEISCRMLGYDNETKGGMKVINIKNYKVIVRKDVTFSEDITIEGMLRTNVFMIRMTLKK